MFPNPDRFDPGRWPNKELSNSILVFSKGRRKCPAAQQVINGNYTRLANANSGDYDSFAHIEMFAIFAAVFCRFRVAAYETRQVKGGYDRRLQLTISEQCGGF